MTGVAMIASRFPPLKRSVPTRGVERRRPTNFLASFNADDFHDGLKILSENNLPKAMILSGLT